ncbi:DUF4160 domain-containing protein [Isoalcanivorax indicus]|uniref:DUF4160 domain-containing protein n=1 Tax=Isoalcanivorax indicus TaxID=2202653 RepID=UPI000DB99B8B|nr:DUF4160 domain-containing protein [Isoalcanivorax indicus]
MPTVLRIGGYRFFFYSNENDEPRHIHIQKAGSAAKFWLDPVTMATSVGFSAAELNKLGKMVEQHRQLFMEAWDEFFGA